MENINSFGKTLNVLYIEDDVVIREKLSKLLKHKFNNVILKDNGLDGFITFYEKKPNNEQIDLIISDLNMPVMDGMTMFEKIRELDYNIPFIVISGKSEPETLLDAINLHVDDYIPKPIDIKVFDRKLNKVIEKLFLKTRINLQKEEIENYIKIINQEAIVVRINKEGLISFVNKAFCSISTYSEEELLGESYKVLFNIRENDWETILNGDIWSGVNKNQSKDGNHYYIKSKVLPLFDNFGEEIIEYISISFLITDEINKKRDKNKKNLHQISIYKTMIATMKSEISLYKSHNDSLTIKTDNFDKKYKKLEESKDSLLKQIQLYENRHLESNKLDLIIKEDKNRQFDEVYKSLKRERSLNGKLKQKIKDLENLIDDKDKMSMSFKRIESDNSKRIINLKDLVSTLEIENRYLKKNKFKLPFSN